MTNHNRRWERWKNWELWPFALIYAPLSPVWLWYIIKARALWFFTPADPTLTFGGFDGEEKREMYDLLPPGTFPKTIFIENDLSFDVVMERVRSNGFQFPFCVKPDKGLKGLLFRKIESKEALQQYHRLVPVPYLVQELLEAPLEVSIFYYRHPAAKSGTVSGFTRKDMMQVTGDGCQTLWQLILQHPKAKHRMEEMRRKHQDRLADVLPAGEVYLLAHAANLNRGATFTNLEKEIDQSLLDLFDQLSHRCSFFYGRYDIKCNSIEALKAGKFGILEFNGTGAEPNHVYHAGYSWLQALAVFAHHWRMMYNIGRYNHLHKGVRYWGNREGYRFLQAAKKHRLLLEKAEQEILI